VLGQPIAVTEAVRGGDGDIPAALGKVVGEHELVLSELLHTRARPCVVEKPEAGAQLLLVADLVVL
jgi:hypothetical protein